MRNIFDYTSLSTSENDIYLSHYGIKGQKWGLRRFQNPDGTLTDEGKKRARKEYKEDNKEAFEKGKTATVLGRAATYAEKNRDRALARYDKKPTLKNREKLTDAVVTSGILKGLSTRAQKEAEDHARYLIDKYGKDAVKDIKYDKSGRVNERTASTGDILASLAVTLGSTAAMAVGATPIALILIPTSANMKGYKAYSEAKNAVKVNRHVK